MTTAERLTEVRKYTGLTWKALAERIGIASPQTFTDIRNGRHGISVRLANKIVKVYPKINRAWLLFGNGRMINEEFGKMPLYDGLTELHNNADAHLIDLGEFFPDAEMALRNTSDAMKEYPVGAILILKRVMDESLLVPGNNYLIETKEFCEVRKYNHGTSPSLISLHATSTKRYDDGSEVYASFEIPMDAATRIFSVLGYVFTEVVNP